MELMIIRKDEEGDVENEAIAVELREENEYVAEVIDQECDERSEEHISILSEIIDSWTSGEHSFYRGFNQVDKKRLNDCIKKRNDITGDIRIDNFIDTINLINRISMFIYRKLSLIAKSRCQHNLKEFY